MSKDRQPRPKDPVEARRVEDVRADLSVLQDALEVLNNFGAPGSPSFVFKRDDATAGTGDYAGTEYIEIEHNLGFTPDRWMIVDANAPGHGDIYALRDSTFVWSDTVAYLAWPDSSPFAGPSAEARVVFFRGGA